MRQVEVVLRRCVFLSNVYLNFFSICINYHIMNKQILLKRYSNEVDRGQWLINIRVCLPELASSGSGTRRYRAGSTDTLYGRLRSGTIDDDDVCAGVVYEWDEVTDRLRFLFRSVRGFYKREEEKKREYKCRLVEKKEWRSNAIRFLLFSLSVCLSFSLRFFMSIQ